MSSIEKWRRSTKTSISTLLLILLGSFTMTGCNTWRGAGEDVENAGDAVKDAVD